MGYGISIPFTIGASTAEPNDLLAKESVLGVINALVLTGSNESPVVPNLTISISSYRGSISRGEQSSIVYVAPITSGLIEAIDSRKNGDLILTRSFVFESAGLTPLSSISMSFKELRYDQGPNNRSASLTGRSTVSFAAAKSISTPVYVAKKQVINNAVPYVNFEVDLKFMGDVNPQDTFTDNGRTYQIETIFFQVNSKSQRATLQTTDIT